MAATHRLSFALLPSPGTRMDIGFVRDRVGGMDALVANDGLHLALAVTRPFDIFPDLAARQMLAIGGAADAEPVAVMLERLAGSAGSVVLSARRRAPFLALHEALTRPMARLGLIPADWRFSPEVVLGSRKGEPFQRPVTAIGWEARDFALIHSVAGQARHQVLGRWPLRRRQGDLFLAC